MERSLLSIIFPRVGNGADRIKFYIFDAPTRLNESYEERMVFLDDHIIIFSSTLLHYIFVLLILLP